MNGSVHMMNGWGYSLMAVITLALCAFVVVIIIATRAFLGTRPTSRPTTTPDQILALRFAHGDIDHDQYLRGQAALAAHLRQGVSVDPD